MVFLLKFNDISYIITNVTLFGLTKGILYG